MKQQKITKKIIEQVILENVKGVRQVIHQPATNMWFLKFASGADITEETYKQAQALSLNTTMKDFEQKHNHHTITAKLNLDEVNTHYAQHYLFRGAN